jgi:hypothetical protein
MTWFERLTGFSEDSPQIVREQLIVDGAWLESRANGRRMRAGRFWAPTLAELRKQRAIVPNGRLRVTEVVGDVRDLHRDPSHVGAVFQVASQFNFLEMISPDVTPEDGIGRYENDLTQGPACAMACGAGTIFRNYLVQTDSGRGQSARSQLDGLDALGAVLGNEEEQLWHMRNGYALATRAGLNRVAQSVAQGRADGLRRLIRVGVQRDTEVTLDHSGQCVTQAYCSAMPVAYGAYAQEDWAAFAKLVLEAAYEATFWLALDRKAPLFLTLLGGGAFGNRMDWIVGAMERALDLFKGCDLDVRIVSHTRPTPALEPLLMRYGL